MLSVKHLKRLTAASAMAFAAGIVAPSSAQAALVAQLGFILDESGSIGSTNWNTIRSGLASAISTYLPADGSYEISVVKFSDNAEVVVDHVLVTDTTSLASVVAAISGAVYISGGTNMAAGFDLMASVLQGSSNWSIAGSAYVNLATDGQPNLPTNDSTGRSAAIASRDTLISTTGGGVGVDNFSIEGIGSGVDTSFLQGSVCYPGPCDTTSPYNFPSQGFYIPIANASEYAAAINQKIRVVTNQDVPEPAGLALVGVGMLGIVVARRNRNATPSDNSGEDCTV